MAIKDPVSLLCISSLMLHFRLPNLSKKNYRYSYRMFLSLVSTIVPPVS